MSSCALLSRCSLPCWRDTERGRGRRRPSAWLSVSALLLLSRGRALLKSQLVAACETLLQVSQRAAIATFVFPSRLFLFIDDQSICPWSSRSRGARVLFLNLAAASFFLLACSPSRHPVRFFLSFGEEKSTLITLFRRDPVRLFRTSDTLIKRGAVLREKREGLSLASLALSIYLFPFAKSLVIELFVSCSAPAASTAMILACSACQLLERRAGALMRSATRASSHTGAPTLTLLTPWQRQQQWQRALPTASASSLSPYTLRSSAPTGRRSIATSAAAWHPRSPPPPHAHAHAHAQPPPPAPAGHAQDPLLDPSGRIGAVPDPVSLLREMQGGAGPGAPADEEHESPFPRGTARPPSIARATLFLLGVAVGGYGIAAYVSLRDGRALSRPSTGSSSSSFGDLMSWASGGSGGGSSQSSQQREATRRKVQETHQRAARMGERLKRLMERLESIGVPEGVRQVIGRTYIVAAER